jgi:hypothetical protein
VSVPGGGGGGGVPAAGGVRDGMTHPSEFFAGALQRPLLQILKPENGQVRGGVGVMSSSSRRRSIIVIITITSTSTIIIIVVIITTID